MKVTVCELPADRSAFQKRWNALCEGGHDARNGIVVLPPLVYEEWSPPTMKRTSDALLNASELHEEWNRRLSALGAARVLGSCQIEFGNQRYDEGYLWDADHGMRSVHARGRSPGVPASGPKQLLSDFTPFEIDGLSVAFLFGAEVYAEDEVQLYGREGIDLLVIHRGARRVPFDEWFAWARDAAKRTDAYVVSSHRAGGVEGHGFILGRDGEPIGQTTSSQATATAHLEVPIPREPREVEPRPAPAWVDPWVTGVPPY